MEGDKRKVVAVIVAGGQGVRFGARKQYMDLAGKPMWHRSADALRSGGVQQLVLVVPEDDRPSLQKFVADSDLASSLSVVVGGSTRFASVRNGLAEVFRNVPASECLVAIHDAARPFVLPTDIQRVVEAAAVTGGAILAKRCPDTVKEAAAGAVQDKPAGAHAYIGQTIPRAALWLAQTPQVFRGEWLDAVYWQIEESDVITDDASVFESRGYPVALVESSGDNHKVTTPADMELARCLAHLRWGDQHANWTGI